MVFYYHLLTVIVNPGWRASNFTNDSFEMNWRNLQCY